MNDNEISRTAQAINDLRPDWPASSLRTFIQRNLATRPYRDVVVALTWVAVDTKPDGTPASDKPARVLEAGPWWIATNAGRTTVTTVAPRREEACATCGRYLASCICGEKATRKPDAGNTAAGVAACRAGLAGRTS